MLANKQDIKGAMNKQQIASFLELDLINDRQWFVQECSAVSGKGLVDGLQWLASAVENHWAQAGK